MLSIIKKLLKNKSNSFKFNLISLPLFYFLICNILLLNIANASNSTKSSTIIVLGDSISSAYGIDKEQGWVNLLQTKIKSMGLNYQIINASVGGDTSRTGLNRFKPLVKKHKPKIVIVELGANDGLRGLPLSEIEASLSEIVVLSKKQNAKVLLAGIRLPPNYGVSYNTKFINIYQKVTTKFKITLIPNILADVDDDKDLMQEDGIHPNADAQQQMLDNVWLKLQNILMLD